jgi:hypothetical protein
VRDEPGGGLYLWGFDDRRGEVIWYVGKATTGKGVYRRLRKHYLDIMSGQYQIPHGFLNGRFETPACSTSGWRIQFGNREQATVLADWSKMQRIFRAGHEFAHCAFARVAIINTDSPTLKALERLVIHQLTPVINKQRAQAVPSHAIEMSENPSDIGWLTQWAQSRDAADREV